MVDIFVSPCQIVLCVSSHRLACVSVRRDHRPSVLIKEHLMDADLVLLSTVFKTGVIDDKVFSSLLLIQAGIVPRREIALAFFAFLAL